MTREDSCLIEQCGGKPVGRGYCKKHYLRLWRRGTTEKFKYDYSEKYVAVHMRVSRINGKASDSLCADCESQAEDWSYDNQDPDELMVMRNGSNIKYSAKPEHYEPRCRRCHKAFDAKHKEERE